MAGVDRWKALTISKLSCSLQVQVARHCAKLPGVVNNGGTKSIVLVNYSEI